MAPRDSVWTLTRPGCLGVDVRLRDSASVSDPGPCRYLRFRPSGDEGTRLLTAPQGAFARAVSIQSARRAVGAQARQAPECATRRNGFGLTALRATELLTSCREARRCQ